ncbi:MAG: hypothetical protein IT447_00450 [Phycisphaerales bacterium]|jgi:hypothetical protein|nr:hypothetical protein [Phycisphaerales bacterium]
MFKSGQLEELICLVSALDRDALIDQFHSYQANFPLDFTPEFFENTPLERLRHIFLALCLQCQRLPEQAMIHAA